MVLNAGGRRDMEMPLRLLTPGDQATCRRLVERNLMEPTETQGFHLTAEGQALAVQIENKLRTPYSAT